MEEWKKISLILTVFGFLKELRPSEPFFFDFITDNRWRNITDEQVNQQVYPVGTYCYLGLLIVGFLITDICRYKPLIIVSGISGILLWSILLWTYTLFGLFASDVMFGVFFSTEVAYYTYIYAKVDKGHFQSVTSHTKVALLLGKASSSYLSQLLVSFHLLNIRELNYITLGAMIAATIWALFLPPVETSIYFHQSETTEKNSGKFKAAITTMKTHFVESFLQREVIKWSGWYVLSTSGFLIAQTYMQALWSDINNASDKSPAVLNGVVEGSIAILGFVGAFSAGYARADWTKWGESSMACCSIAQGCLLFIGSQAEVVWISYVIYVLFGGLYHFMVTIVSSEIAKRCQEDSYGLVFGFNMFLAILSQTILTMIFADKDGFALGVRSLYITFGAYHVLIAIVYMILQLLKFCSNENKMSIMELSNER